MYQLHSRFFFELKLNMQPMSVNIKKSFDLSIRILCNDFLNSG